MENLYNLVVAAETKAAALALTPEDVARVYSGKPGCGCGCRGQYRANPAHAKADDVVNMVQVRKVLAKVQDAARAGEAGFTGDVAGGIFAFETETRYLWVYTTKAR
jgi:hypothetical protein